MTMMIIVLGAMMGCGREPTPSVSSDSFIQQRPSTARTMQFDVKVQGLPSSLNVPKSSAIERDHRFRVYADRDSEELTIDSLDDDQRWRFAQSKVTHARGRVVKDLGTDARRLADRVMAGLFDEFADCRSQEITDPADFGWTGPNTTSTTWRKVDCSWVPRDRVPTMFLGYTQYVPEPPQLTRVRFTLDGDDVEVRLSRVVYDEELPQSASSPVKKAPEKYYVPPLRPGATSFERRHHEQAKQILEK